MDQISRLAEAVLFLLDKRAHHTENCSRNYSGEELIPLKLRKCSCGLAKHLDQINQLLREKRGQDVPS